MEKRKGVSVYTNVAGIDSWDDLDCTWSERANLCKQWMIADICIHDMERAGACTKSLSHIWICFTKLLKQLLCLKYHESITLSATPKTKGAWACVVWDSFGVAGLFLIIY